MDNAYNDMNQHYIPDNIPPVDDAWDKMKSMLDAEMPDSGGGASGGGKGTGAGKPFRGSNLFWGGIIALLTVTGVYYFSSKKDDNISSNTASTETIGKDVKTGNEQSNNNNEQNIVDDDSQKINGENKKINTADNSGKQSAINGNDSLNRKAADAVVAGNNDNKKSKAGIVDKSTEPQTGNSSLKNNASNKISSDSKTVTKSNINNSNKSLIKANDKTKQGLASDKLSTQKNGSVQAAIKDSKRDKQKNKIVGNKNSGQQNSNSVLQNDIAVQKKTANRNNNTPSDSQKSNNDDNVLKSDDKSDKTKNDKQADADNNIADNNNTTLNNTQQTGNDKNDNSKNVLTDTGNKSNININGSGDTANNNTSPGNNNNNDQNVTNSNSPQLNTSNAGNSNAAGTNANAGKTNSTKGNAKGKGNSGKGAGIDIDAGLQLNPVLPITGNGYSYNLNGSVAPYTNFIPGAYLGVNLGKSVLTLDINPWHVNYLSGKPFYDSTRTVTIIDSGISKTFSVNNNKSFLKTFSFNAGIGWDYKISDHFSAGLSLRGNFGINALVRSSGYSDSTGVRVNFTDSFYKAGSGDLSLLSKSQFWLMPQFMYTTGRWQFGLRAGMPLNKISLNALNTPKYPFNAELLIRFNLNKKR